MLDRRSKWNRWLLVMLSLSGALGAFAVIACRTPAPPLPPGVTKETIAVPLTGRAVKVDVFFPSAAGEAPVVLVVHGFSRGRRHMAGWGGLLAANGFIAAVPDQPAFIDPERNGRAIAELLDKIRSRAIALPCAPNGKAALVGFSMGGLTTLLAAVQTHVDAWVGLDPVDTNGHGRMAAKAFRHPAAVLRAEPGIWNWQGNARKLIAAFKAPLFALRVSGATHLDVECPSDLLGRLACGPTDPARRQVFERYTLAFLRSVLAGDADAAKQLQAASTDPAVADVIRVDAPPVASAAVEQSRSFRKSAP